MRTLLVAAVVTLAAAVPARADSHHAIDAGCAAASPGVAGGTAVVVGTAVATGHVRPVSTSVRCVVSLRDDTATYEQTTPGAATAVTGVGPTGYGDPYVCATAWGYWSDGHTLGPETRCAHRSILIAVEDTR